MKNEEKKIDVNVTESDEIPEAVLRDLMNTYDRIDLMSLQEVNDKLRRFHLDTKGSESILRENLKNSYKTLLLNGKDLSLCKDLSPYFIVIDFEATCDENNSPNYRHEIIEFPAVLVNSKKQKIVDCFQMYCKPEIHPIISKFCSELTGITQEQIDTAETFDKVLIHFQKWLAKHKLDGKKKFVVVTDGPWDMTRFLFNQCHYSNVLYPKWAYRWVNLKKTFNKFYKCNRFCLTNMLDYLGLKLEGRHHCGLDDARNIARILLKMIYDGANIQVNERLTTTITKKFKEKTKKTNSHLNIDKSENNINSSNEVHLKRVDAQYKPIYYVEEMPIYKRKRKQRLIAEAQLARKIFSNQPSLKKNSVLNNLKKDKEQEVS